MDTSWEYVLYGESWGKIAVAETPVSLLERLRKGPDPQGWQQLVNLYRPLLFRWLHRYALQPQDAEDLVQDVLTTLVRELPHFRHNQRPGAFRHWLRTILIHRLRHFWRSRDHRPEAAGGSSILQKLEQLEDPHSDLGRLWDQEHDHHVIGRLLQAIHSEFRPITWQAFEDVMLQGGRPAHVAARLGISVNAVLLAKSRVLHRLRQEALGILD